MKRKVNVIELIWHRLLTVQVNKKVGREYNQRVQFFVHFCVMLRFEKQVFAPIT